MSKVNGVVNTITKIITWVLVVLLMLGIIGGVAYFALRSQGVTFYVEYGGEKYFAAGEGGSIKLYNLVDNSFSVRSLKGEDVNYDVKVYANSANDFAFSHNDNKYHFVRTDDETYNDYTEIFGTKKGKEGFTLTFPQDFTPEQAVKRKYGGDIVLSEPLNQDYAYFVIEVTSDKSSVKLWYTFENFVISTDSHAVVF